MPFRVEGVLFYLACTACAHRYESYCDSLASCPRCSGEPRVRGLVELYSLTEDPLDGENTEA